MKKYATAYINLFENEVKAKVIEAENEVQAALKAVVTTEKMDDAFKEWLDNMSKLNLQELKDELLNGEIGVDVVEIKLEC